MDNEKSAIRENHLARLPPFISHFLGYRSKVPPPVPQYLVLLWSFIGAFGGLAVIQAIFERSPYFTARHVPPIVASFGASAVLCYGAIEAPLAQPRALMCGHFIAALIGVCVTKLFEMSADVEGLRWLAGCLATSLAIVAMQVTGTTHPPAGATALLAAVEPEVYGLGWYFLPVVLLSSAMVLVAALLANNVQRRYPVYWIRPAVPKSLVGEDRDGEGEWIEEKDGDGERE